MKPLHMRAVSSAMTGMAFAVLFALHAAAAAPAVASACCETCEANLWGCELGCGSNNHEAIDDSVGVCTDWCNDEMYSCFAHCIECDPPPHPVCVFCVIDEEYWYDPGFGFFLLSHHLAGCSEWSSCP